MACEDKCRYYNAKMDYEDAVSSVSDALSVEENNETETRQTVHSNKLDFPVEYGNSLYTPNMVNVNDCNPSLCPFSEESIAILALKLDADSIDFLVKVLK